MSEKAKKRKSGCLVFVVLALILSIFGGGSDVELEKIVVEWPKATFDINEIVELEVTPYPEDAVIEELEMSGTTIAEMTYSDDVATIKFKEVGTADISFIANGEIDSGRDTITVIDKAAEEKKKQEEAVKKKKEEEKKQAASDSGSSGSNKASSSASNNSSGSKSPSSATGSSSSSTTGSSSSNKSSSASTNSSSSDTQTEMVWIPQSGKKYHSSASCSGMKNPSKVSLSEAKNLGLEACNKCY